MARIVIDRELCKGCELCCHTCPRKLITRSNSLNRRGLYPVQFNDTDEECTACTFCALICPDTAIEVYK